MESNSLQTESPYRGSASETIAVPEFFRQMRDESDKVLKVDKNRLKKIETWASEGVVRNGWNSLQHCSRRKDISIEVHDVSKETIGEIKLLFEQVENQIDIQVRIKRIITLVRHEVMDLRLEKDQTEALKELIRSEGSNIQVSFIAAAWLMEMVGKNAAWMNGMVPDNSTLPPKTNL